jgi:hypothetical protein
MGPLGSKRTAYCRVNGQSNVGHCLGFDVPGAMDFMGTQSFLPILVALCVYFTKGHRKGLADAWNRKKPDKCRAQSW